MNKKLLEAFTGLRINVSVARGGEQYGGCNGLSAAAGASASSAHSNYARHEALPCATRTHIKALFQVKHGSGMALECRMGE